MIGTDGEKESRESMLSEQSNHDNDDDDDNNPFIHILATEI